MSGCLVLLNFDVGESNFYVFLTKFSTNSVAVFRLNEYADSGRSKYYLSKLIHTIENVSFVGQASNIGDGMDRQRHNVIK